MVDGVLLSRRAVETLRRDHQRLKNQVRNLEQRLRYAHTPSVVGQVYHGVTGTSTKYPTYPASGNVVPVNLERWSFTEVAGSATIGYYPSTRAVLASTIDDSLPASGTHVVLDRLPGKPGRRWWIRRGVFVAARVTDTGANAANNAVEAETGVLNYGSGIGRHLLGFTASTPQNKFVVYQMSGHGPPPRIGDLVVTAQIDNESYIVYTNAKCRLKARVDTPGGIAVDGTGPVVIWENGLATSRIEYASLNWMATSALVYQKECIVQWYDDEQKWVIENAEC